MDREFHVKENDAEESSLKAEDQPVVVNQDVSKCKRLTNTCT